MATQEVPVKANLNVVLKSDTEQLEEVMVVAYGTAKKSAFTGSAATIKNEKIATRQTSNVTNALAGQVAGLRVIMVSRAKMLKCVFVVLDLYRLVTSLCMW